MQARRAVNKSCPGCGDSGVAPIATTSPRVAAWLCAACGLSWAITVANPAARLAVAMPFGEVIGLDALASVAVASWSCRLCGAAGSLASTPAANRDATAHLITHHRATIG